MNNVDVRIDTLAHHVVYKMLMNLRETGQISYLDALGMRNCNFGYAKDFVRALDNSDAVHTSQVIAYVAHHGTSWFMKSIAHFAMWARNPHTLRAVIVCGYLPFNPADVDPVGKPCPIHVIETLDSVGLPINELMVSAICNTFYLGGDAEMLRTLRYIKSIHQKFPQSPWETREEKKLSLWDITLAIGERKRHVEQVFAAFPDGELSLGFTMGEEVRSTLKTTFNLAGATELRQFPVAQSKIITECYARARTAMFQMGVGLMALDLPVLLCVKIAQIRVHDLGMNIPRFYLWELFKAIKHFGR